MASKSNLEPVIAKDSLRVLHAEDSDDCAVLVRRALSRAGFGTGLVRVNDGERAIGLLSTAEEKNRPHVILLDVNMPLKNGFDVLDWMRRNPHYRSTPVVMLTASAEDEDVVRAQRLGVTKFLQKEGTYRKVVETLETLLVESASREDGRPPMPR